MIEWPPGTLVVQIPVPRYCRRWRCLPPGRTSGLQLGEGAEGVVFSPSREAIGPQSCQSLDPSGFPLLGFLTNDEESTVVGFGERMSVGGQLTQGHLKCTVKIPILEPTGAKPVEIVVYGRVNLPP